MFAFKLIQLIETRAEPLSEGLMRRMKKDDRCVELLRRVPSDDECLRMNSEGDPMKSIATSTIGCGTRPNRKSKSATSGWA